jgi:hypothetical protein
MSVEASGQVRDQPLFVAATSTTRCTGRPGRAETSRSPQQTGKPILLSRRLCRLSLVPCDGALDFETPKSRR